MILLFDRGNRATKAALARQGRIERRWRDESSDAEGAIRRILAEASPERIAFSSVIPEWTETAKRIFAERGGMQALEITSRIRFPFEIRVERPERVGSDRLSAAAGACALGEREAIIVDAGTAITIDLLSKREFLGGAIAPGVSLMLHALHRWTAALPFIEEGGEAPIFPARSTEEAMLAGARIGAVGIVRELAGRARSSLGGKAPLFITGGGGAWLAERLGAAEDVRFEPDLVFRGIMHLFDLNRGRRAR